MPINTLKHKVTINESDLVSQNKHQESNRVESKKKKKNKQTKPNRLTDIESRLVVIQGKGGWGEGK